MVSPWRRSRRVLGLNARNLLYVYQLNPRRHFPLADNKIRTKRALLKAGVPAPASLALMTGLAEVSRAKDFLIRTREFVVKPAQGRQGSGIVVITGHDGERFVGPGGRRLTWEDLKRCMGDILFGVHSVGHSDTVLVEKRLRPHAAYGGLAEYGLPDVRVILLHAAPAMAMMRVPTRDSGGRANLHQGAVGLALRLSDGLAFRASIRGTVVSTHPDNGHRLTGFHLDLWDEIVALARRAAACLPLPFLGVDIVLDEEDGPVVMEVNVRPGLEIQNVNGVGLRGRLQRLVALEDTAR